MNILLYDLVLDPLSRVIKFPYIFDRHTHTSFTLVMHLWLDFREGSYGGRLAGLQFRSLAPGHMKPKRH